MPSWSAGTERGSDRLTDTVDIIEALDCRGTVREVFDKLSDQDLLAIVDTDRAYALLAIKMLYRSTAFEVPKLRIGGPVGISMERLNELITTARLLVVTERMARAGEVEVIWPDQIFTGSIRVTVTELGKRKFKELEARAGVTSTADAVRPSEKA